MNRTRIFGLLPISILILGGAMLPGMNAMAQSAGIAVGSASRLPGATVTIPVSFAAGATSVSTVQFDLMFSSSIIYGSTATGAAASAAAKSSLANPITGGVRVLIFGLNPNAISSGVLANVQLTISGNAPVSIIPISITGIVASDSIAVQVSAVGSNGVVQVLAPLGTTRLVISGVMSSNVTSTSATLSWATNEASDSQIEYGTTAAYGSSTALDAGMVTSHSQTLTGLTAHTLYHYRVKSHNGQGNLTVSDDYTFTTGQRGIAPVISAITVSGVTDKSATISWATDTSSDSVVEYWLTNQPLRKSVLADPVTQHSLTLNELKRLSEYRFRLKSTDSEGNEGISQEFTFKTIGTGTSLPALPRSSLTSGQQSPNEDMMIGIALANIGTRPASLTFTAVDPSGDPIAGPGIVNPSVRELNSGAQLAMLDLNIFGEGLAASNSSGWIKLESTSSDVGGFFLTFDSGLSLMDGASFGYAAKNFIFTEIEPAGLTQIEIVNTSSKAANISLSLMKADGTVRGRQTRSINANGALIADLFGDLFTGIAPNPTDYVLMRSTENSQSFQLMKKSVGDISLLSGQDATAGATILYSPQYVMGDPWRSSLSVVNLDPKPGILTLQLFGNDGAQIGVTRTMGVPANGKIRIDDPEFFTPLKTATITSGYVKIGSDGIRLSGSTVFGDDSRQSFSSALPLIYNLKNSVLFSHVASNDTYFTSIAIVNPGLLDANVVIDVYGADGRLIDRTLEIVPPMQRRARLLTEYIPLLTGRDLSSGYIRLTSDWPVASFSLFGTNNLSVLSAIPAQ